MSLSLLPLSLQILLSLSIVSLYKRLLLPPLLGLTYFASPARDPAHGRHRRLARSVIVCVYVCKYIYIYIYINYLFIHTHTYTYTHVYIHKYVLTCVYIYIYNMYVCIYICIYIYIYMYIFVCLSMNWLCVYARPSPVPGPSGSLGFPFLALAGSAHHRDFWGPLFRGPLIISLYVIG